MSLACPCFGVRSNLLAVRSANRRVFLGYSGSMTLMSEESNVFQIIIFFTRLGQHEGECQSRVRLGQKVRGLAEQIHDQEAGRLPLGEASETHHGKLSR